MDVPAGRLDEQSMVEPLTGFRLLYARPVLPLPLRPLLALSDDAGLEGLTGIAPVAARFLLDFLPAMAPDLDELVLTTTRGPSAYHTAVPGLLEEGGRLRFVASRIVLKVDGKPKVIGPWLDRLVADFSHELGHVALRCLLGWVPRGPNLLRLWQHGPDHLTDGFTALSEGFSLFCEHLAGTVQLSDAQACPWALPRRGDEFSRSELACAVYLARVVDAGVSLAELAQFICDKRPWTFRSLVRHAVRDPHLGERAREVWHVLETSA